MREEKLQSILERLEKSPDMPLLIVNDSEAQEAFLQVRKEHRHARLVILRGMRYIAATDAAVGVLLEHLERERLQAAKTLAEYDKEIADIRRLMGSSDSYIYWADNCTIPPPGWYGKGEK